jgi:hypothetical protein
METNHLMNLYAWEAWRSPGTPEARDPGGRSGRLRARPPEPEIRPGDLTKGDPAEGQDRGS